MKKIVFAVLFIASISGVFGYVNGHKSSTELSSLEMDNVEALTDDESVYYYVPCNTSGLLCSFRAVTADGRLTVIFVEGLSLVLNQD